MAALLLRCCGIPTRRGVEGTLFAGVFIGVLVGPDGNPCEPEADEVSAMGVGAGVELLLAWPAWFGVDGIEWMVESIIGCGVAEGEISGDDGLLLSSGL